MHKEPKMLTFLLLIEGLIRIPTGQPVPPQAPPVKAAPKQAPCVCGPNCKCEEQGKTCPGQCPVNKVRIPFFSQELEVGPPKGYPPAPPGYAWEKNPLGPDGWGLREVKATKAAVAIPPGAKLLTDPRDGRTFFYRCDGTKCVPVYVNP